MSPSDSDKNVKVTVFRHLTSCRLALTYQTSRCHKPEVCDLCTDRL